AASLQLSMPAAVAASSPFGATVTAVDAYGNPGAMYTGMVHFSSSDAAAVLPANYTFSLNDQGTHTFSVALNTLGNQTLTVTDVVSTANGMTSAAATMVNPEPAGLHFTITSPTTSTAGSAFDVTITALGADNNPATGYTGSVHFTTSDLRGGQVPM